MKYFLSYLLFLCTVTSCVYKFPLANCNTSLKGNLYIEHSLNPQGFLLSTNIFDQTLQHELIRRIPQLNLVSRNQADLFMRITLKNHKSQIMGEEEFSKGKVAGINDYTNEAQGPLSPFALEDIKTKKFFAATHGVDLVISVEMWNLISQKKVFSREYSFANQQPFLFHPRSQLLEKNASETKMLRESSKLIASALVGDILSQKI